MKIRWIYYAVATILLLVYSAGEATGMLVISMLIILPVELWVISEIFGNHQHD